MPIFSSVFGLVKARTGAARSRSPGISQNGMRNRNWTPVRIARAVRLARSRRGSLAEDTALQIEKAVAGIAEEAVQADADPKSDVQGALHAPGRGLRESAPRAVARDPADDADERAELGAEPGERGEPGTPERDRRLQQDSAQNLLERGRRLPVGSALGPADVEAAGEEIRGPLDRGESPLQV
jgi:hypothetical protein